MPVLTTDTGGGTSIVAQGSGSVVSLPLLTSLISGQGGYTSARWRRRRAARSRLPF